MNLGVNLVENNNTAMKPSNLKHNIDIEQEDAIKPYEWISPCVFELWK